MRNLRRTATSLSLVLALAACGGSSERPEYPSTASTDPSADDMGLATADADAPAESETPAEEAAPTPPPPMVVQGVTTPIEGTVPSLRVTAPRAGQTIRSGAVTVRFDLRNWELASPSGPHVHVIVDNEPYMAVRATEPFDLAALVQQNLGHPLAEGTHVLRMFPSRGQHESVKSPGAFAVVVFHYGHATEGFSFDPTAPLLTFSRPKGCNPAGTHVLLDFFVANAELGTDSYRVRYTLDGTSGLITSWEPHWLENLGEGDHTIRLELLDMAGNPVPGMFNDTTRTFSVAGTCP
ncbi:MAG: hypothetical protein U0234_14685 [Sandaracinus sp.]